MTNLTEDTKFGIIQASFGPRIAIFASNDVTEACKRNNLADFSSLLRPFEYVDRVSVRHSNYSTTVQDSLRLSFFPAEKLFEEPPDKEEESWIKNYLSGKVLTKKNIDQWTSSSSSSSPSTSALPSLSSNLTINPTSFRLKKENEWLGSEIEENEDYPKPSTPWYNAFLSSLLEYRPLVEYDYSSHPVAAMIVVSTNHPEPLNEFAQLYEASDRDGTGWPKKDWFDTSSVLRYYLLVHEINEEPDGGKAGATQLLESIKRAYGLNCGLFCMNSEHSEWLKKQRTIEKDPHFISSEEKQQRIDYWSKYHTEASTDEEQSNKKFGEFISDEDILALKVLLREFTLQSLVPHVERSVQHWNESLAASRKGITGRLFSVGRKYFAKAAPGSGTSVIPQSPNAYNPVTRSYPHLSQEAQTRRLADYSFMLGDYKFASQMYEHVRKDAQSDKAWSYCSSAIQMIGICTLLQSSFNQRSKLSADLQSYLFDHLAIASTVGHLRMIMIYYELSKAIGNSHLMSSSLIRAATTRDELISGILYEQVSHSAPSRQATMFTILAAHRYELAQQDWLSAICFKQCSQLTGWDWMEDYLDKRIGKIAESESNWVLAAQRYWNILKRRIKAAETVDQTGDGTSDDEIYFSLLKNALQEGRSDFLVSNPLDPSCIRLVDVETSKIRIPQQQNYYDSLSIEDPDAWDRLATQYKDQKLVSSLQGNIAMVNEYFYLDLFFKNPLAVKLRVTNIEINLKSLLDDSGNNTKVEGVEMQPVEDLLLLPLERRRISVKLLSTLPDISFEITGVNYKFDSLFNCSQDLHKRGDRLQSTLTERRGRFYSIDKSKQIKVTQAKPIIELVSVENMVKEVYAGESLMDEFEVRNSGKVQLKGLSCVISHNSFFWICDSREAGQNSTIYEPDGTFKDEKVLELPNHLVNDSPVLIVDELEPASTIKVRLFCRGESVGKHKTCWLFVFQSATTGEYLTYRHVQSLVVLPSLDIRPIIRPSDSNDAFYSLILEIRKVGIPEDEVELTMISTIGSSWRSRMISNKTDCSKKIIASIGDSQSLALSFDILPWSGAEEDQMMPMMLKQIKKLLLKEQLKESDVSGSKVKLCACTTIPPEGKEIKLDSSMLLKTIISSHRNLRKQSISTKFTTLTESQLSSIFPLSTTRSLDLIIFWKTKDSNGSNSKTGVGRRPLSGHHFISDLKFGSTIDFVGKVIENYDRGKKNTGIYEESQREQKNLIAQFKKCEFGRWEDPIQVQVQVENQFIDWDFKRDGPFVLNVKFILKNRSTTNMAQYELTLNCKNIDRLETFKNNPNSNYNENDKIYGYDYEGCEWIGKLKRGGRLKKLEAFEIDCKCIWNGSGVKDIGNWKIESSYFINHRNEGEGEGDSDEEGDGFLEFSPIWKVLGNKRLISVNDISK